MRKRSRAVPFRRLVGVYLAGLLALTGVGTAAWPAAAATLTLDASTCSSFGGVIISGECRWYRNAPSLAVSSGDTLTVGIDVSYGAPGLTNDGTIDLPSSSFTTYTDYANAGTVSVGSKGAFVDQQFTFTNDGTFTVAGGGRLVADGSNTTTAFVNNGSIALSAGAVLLVTNGATFTNNGTMTAECGAFVGGTITGNQPVFPADCVPPVASPTISPAPNGAGWNSSAVTVTWNWADNSGGSGIDPSACKTSTTSSGEGVQVLSGSCTDLAGNTGKANVTVKVDETAPTLVLTGGSADGGTYPYGSVPAPASCTASDALSGAAGITCEVSGYSAATGTHTVTYAASDPAGNTATATVHYTVTSSSQAISFPPPPSPASVGSTYPLYAEATSGLPVSFSVDISSTPGACGVFGNTAVGFGVDYFAPGTCVIDADQAGDPNYLPAPQTRQSVVVARLPQSVAFTAPVSPAVAGGSAELVASSDSGLPVALSVDASTTAGACSVSGSTVTYTGPGSCVLDADQPGDDTYLPAAQVQRTVLVAYTSTGFTSPLPKSTLLKSGSTIPVKFTLATADGSPIPAATAVGLASSGAVSVVLTGSGISPVTASCGWNTLASQFQCQLKTPSRLKTGTGNPYVVTAYQSIPTVGGSTLVPVSTETVFFK